MGNKGSIYDGPFCDHYRGIRYVTISGVDCGHFLAPVVRKRVNQSVYAYFRTVRVKQDFLLKLTRTSLGAVRETKKSRDRCTEFCASPYLCQRL